MLSTAQALRQWEGVLAVLSEVKEFTATHPKQPIPSLAGRLSASCVEATKDLASPHVTWKKLLQSKVPFKVLAACSKVVPAHSPVMFAAASMLTAAVAHLVQAAPGPSSSSGGSSSSSSSSSGSRGSSKLASMMWDQLEQSGLLEQLPVVFRNSINFLQAHITAGHFLQGDAQLLYQYVSSLLEVLQAVLKLQPSYLSAHAAGQQCAAPAMQLSQLSLQYISKALEQQGPQQWLQDWLVCAWKGATAAAQDTAQLLGNVLAGNQQVPLSGSGGSSGRRGDTAAAALSVQAATHAVWWVCLDVVVRLLELFHKQATSSTAARSGGSSSSSSSSKSASSSGASSNSSLGAANSNAATSAHGSSAPRAAGTSHTHLRQPAARSSTSAGEQWLPAVLAPRLPAAYGTMLEQLGCSREVGLWLAMVAGCETEPEAEATAWDGLERYVGLLPTLLHRKLLAPQQAALHLSVAAVTLQWLSDMPPDRLAGMGLSCLFACTVADAACKAGHHKLPQPAAGVRAQALAAGQAVVQSSMAVLEKLLRVYRGLPGDGPCSANASMAGDSDCSNSSNSSIVLQASGKVADVLTFALFGTAKAQRLGNAASLDQDIPGAGRLPPAQSAKCCQLLQDFMRLLAAATAADPSNDTTIELLVTMLQSLYCLCHRSQPRSGECCSVGGPLVAAVGAAGDVSSPSALQLFGLLSTINKVFGITAALLPLPLKATSVHRALTTTSCGVSVAVVCMLQPSLYQSSGGTCPASSSCCSAALPWLVLLGRCCLACTIVLELWQGWLGSAAAQSALHRLAAAAAEGTLTASEPTAAAPDTVRAAAATQHQTAVAVTLDDHWLLTVENLQLLQTALAGVWQWLAAADIQQQLADLGYQPQHLQHRQLQEAAEALASCCTALRSELRAADPVSAASLLPAICAQLQTAGRALTCFAIPHACNNLACANVSGPSEAGLVGGRSCICAGCRTARYCGRACQRQAWRQHKPVCKALAAAAAAAAGGGGAAGAAADQAETDSKAAA